MKELTTALETQLWELALTVRETEEKLLQLFKDGEVGGTVHTCIGQEFSGVSVCTQLEKGDFIFSNHRGHGHFLSWTRNIEGLFAELMGRRTGVCGGLGGSQHLRQGDFYSNGIQGGIVPVSLGLALARKIQKQNRIGAVFIGDGTLGEGSVYEGFNLAALWDLPLLFVLEDNGIAQSTPTRETTAGKISARPEAFGLRVFEGATSDWKTLYGRAGEAIDFVRREGKPAFLKIETSRLRAHSKGDDTRDEREMQGHHQRDPLNAFLASEQNQNILQRVRKKVDEACFAASRAEPAALPANATRPPPREWSGVKLDRKSDVGAEIHRSFRKIMDENPKVHFIGEDVKAPYGGAFKISRDLSEVFPERVHGTPISEASLIGIGTGLALEGFKPFIEIMFGDFLLLGADQIVNHAAKFQQMYGSSLSVDVTVRTPMGGRRGYGPTHSQSLEKHFLGVPGLRVLALHNLLPPEKIFSRLASSSCGPTLLIENKVGYTRALAHSLAEGFEVVASDQDFPVVVVQPQSRQIDVTLLCYGGMVDEAAAAADILFRRHEIICQIVAPTQLFPFSIQDCGDFLERASQLVVIEEGSRFGAFSSEVLAQLFESGKNLKVHRLSAPDICIPSAPHLEAQVLPAADSIVKFVSGLKI